MRGRVESLHVLITILRRLHKVRSEGTTSNVRSHGETHWPWIWLRVSRWYTRRDGGSHSFRHFCVEMTRQAVCSMNQRPFGLAYSISHGRLRTLHLIQVV